MTTDRDFMKLAIDEARMCRAEDERVHPMVGAVVVKDGVLLAKAHRGELAGGDHAEFTALEKKLSAEALAGSTVYTTLEPCTTRNHPKVPCAERLIERKIARVVIGTLDPNPAISGKGQRRLREASIATDLFPADLMAEIEELNREFTRYQKRQDERPVVSDEIIKQYATRSLDDWYRISNRIFWNQNFQREASAIFAHLVEVVGGLSALASNKRKAGNNPETYIVKALAWWLALCGKLGIRSVEDMLWDKFPAVCSYCQQVPHDPDTCTERKAASGGPPWSQLATLGQRSTSQRPKRLRDWQVMFSRIYPAQQTEEFGPSFARLAEELGELAEAVRVFRAEPGYILSEAADVFAWLMHIQNIVDSKAQVPSSRRGETLELAFAKAYPDGCTACGKRQCTCPPILASTIGRIAHEVPSGRGSYADDGRFMPPDKASKFFQDA
jgi:pyrimidine deaminase RibD-like protein/NTP pyrophosphatase (non-canonical NTP hydrolase)